MFGTHSRFLRVKWTRYENSVHHFGESAGVLSEVPDCFVCFGTKISGRGSRLLGSYSPFPPPPCANLMLRLCARACVRARRSVLWTLEAIHLVPNARDGYHYHLIPFCEPQAIAVKRALRRPAVHSVLPGRNQEKTGETCVLRDLGSTVRSVLWESQVCIRSTRATSLNHKF